MRTRILSTVLAFTLVIVTLVGAAGFSVARAQDEPLIVCDSTVITLLFLAERHYGFTSETLDLATFDKGQFALGFDSMPMLMDEQAMATEEPMTDDAAAGADGAAMMEQLTLLTPGVVEGENEACTALREEIETFLFLTIREELLAMLQNS